jgi:prephenate dehydratase
VILQENIQDNAENFTRFVLLLPPEQADLYRGADANKISLAMRLAHKPGALLASLEPFANHGVNLLKIESRPIHGRPWEYQFYLDVEAEEPELLELALKDAAEATSELRVLGKYAAARR